jgi:hypothetical protein
VENEVPSDWVLLLLVRYGQLTVGSQVIGDGWRRGTDREEGGGGMEKESKKNSSGRIQPNHSSESRKKPG